MSSDQGSSTKNAYRTSAKYQLDDRRLILRGGSLDGQSWTGVIAVGKRVLCGDQAWSKDAVYVVTPEIEVDAEGVPANVAVPAFQA
jgi:hypothetical protein